MAHYNLPPIFSPEGVFIDPPNQDQMPADVVAALKRVRETYERCMARESAVKKLETEIREAVKQQVDAQAVVKPFGPYTFMDEWRAMVRNS